MNRVLEIKKLAAKHHYDLRSEQPNIGLLIFIRVGVQINVYTTKMTVATCLDHPKKGKTQLFRKYVDMKTMDELFANPRKHTGAGYYNS